MADQIHSEAKRLGDGSLLTEDADFGLGHMLSAATYGKVLAALLVLTAVTVAVSRVDLGLGNMLVAIMVASLKAGLVAFWFMHLKFEKKVVLGFALYPIIILALLIGGTLSDSALRTEVHPEVKSEAK